jgi:hypothetical protein
MDKFAVDQKKVEQKAEEIGALLDGMSLPEVFGVLGTVIAKLYAYTQCQTDINVKSVIISWLDQVKTFVNNIKARPIDNIAN